MHVFSSCMTFDLGNCSCLMRTWGLYRAENQGIRKPLNFKSYFWVAVLIFDDITSSMLLMVTLRFREPRSQHGEDMFQMPLFSFCLFFFLF